MANGTPRVKRMKSKVMKHVKQDSMLIEHMASAFYRHVNPKRAQEIMDSRMIQEDHNAISNLSPEFINRQFDANKYMQSLGRKDESSEIGS